MKKRLTKSQNKIVSGVFGGIAEYFDLDPTVVRLIGLAIIIFTGFLPGIIFYVIAAVIMPEGGSHNSAMDGDFDKK